MSTPHISAGAGGPAGPGGSATIDWTPLTAPVTQQQVRTWKAAARASGASWASSGIAPAVVTFVLLLPIIAMLALFGVVLLVGSIAALASGGDVLLAVVGLGVAVLVGLLVALCVVGLAKVLPDERRWARWLRLDWFARSNGLLFSPADANPAYPGAIFGIGRSRRAVDHIRSTEGRFFDMGNFQYVVGDGKNSRTIAWGFLALALDRRVPHMLLDSVRNNTAGSPTLAGRFARDQVLSLEGDFDRWFTLYCPREYERDALYVFTPDLMALCIDEVAPFDVEVVDDWMFVYSPRPFRMDDPALLHRLLRIIETVGAKTLSRTVRYRDERVPGASPPAALQPGPKPGPVPGIVAPQGRRLRTRFPTAVVVVLLVVLGLPLALLVVLVLGIVAGVLASA